MKNGRDFRNRDTNSYSEDLLKKATRLEPIKKSGKDKKVVIEDEDEDDDIVYRPKRESILDFYDDRDDDSDEDLDEDEEDYDEDWDEDEEEEYDDDYEEEKN